MQEAPTRLRAASVVGAKPVKAGSGPARARVLAAVLGLTFLGACMPSLQLPHEAEAELERAEWLVRPPDEAWVNVPSSRLLLERRAAGLAEQRVLLPNHTSLRGENLLHVRTVTRVSRGTLFDLERTLAFIGGLPFPFSDADLNVMQSRTDAAGTLIWTAWTNGAGLTCVLALRRLEVGARIVPAGASSLDLVMRNCVNGEDEEALVPAGPSTVAFPAPPGVADGAPLRTLSPLAAPGI